MNLNENSTSDLESRLSVLHSMIRKYVKTIDEVCSDLSSMISSGTDLETMNFVRLIVLVKGSSITLWEWAEQNKELGYIPNEQEMKNFIDLISNNQMYNFQLAYYYNTMLAAENHVLVKLPRQEDRLIEIDASIKGIWAFSSKMLNEIMQEQER